MMKRFSVFALTILMLATLVGAPFVHGSSAIAQERLLSVSHGSHAEMHGPAGTVEGGKATVCQLLCAATVLVPSGRLEPIRLRWGRVGYAIGRALVSHGTAPDAPERPPKGVAV